MNSNIIDFAIEAHQSTNHLYDGKSYSTHLMMTVEYAKKYLNIIPEHYQDIVIDACWLHDTIEDCRLTYNDIRKISNTSVADIVYALTNEKGKTRKERANDKYYEGIKNTPYAKFVKLCDRLANVRYSVDTNSKMKDVYKSENKHFIKSLFNNVYEPYDDMVKELETLLDE
jgi:(p)ppGpp synthase/HD superfamily hydrolase